MPKETLNAALIFDEAHEAQCHAISKEFNIPRAIVPQLDPGIQTFLLFFQNEKLTLKSTEKKFGKPINIDFLSGKLWHRYRFGGGKGQLIAKAVGVKTTQKLSILDLTAGLGQDAFVLASLGCRVRMLERSPVVAALLQDALKRAKEEPWFAQLNLELIFKEAKSYLISMTEDKRPEIIYFDPMFPESKKSALVKKEMRLLRELLGDDLDADELLDLALKCARKKVVVKRPRLAKPLADRKPDLCYEGKSSRFDVYLATELCSKCCRHPPA